MYPWGRASWTRTAVICIQLSKALSQILQDVPICPIAERIKGHHQHGTEEERHATHKFAFPHPPSSHSTGSSRPPAYGKQHTTLKNPQQLPLSADF